ncbi:MAG: hypothetical protein RL359_645 [Actinomycetota bacterium]|jgi:hypothetical protein
MSNAFTALIWWVIPLTGLLGALGYVVWVTQFKSKFESETTRSVGQFQRFQDSFRSAEIKTNTAGTADDLTDPSTDGAPAGSSTSD